MHFLPHQTLFRIFRNLDQLLWLGFTIEHTWAIISHSTVHPDFCLFMLLCIKYVVYMYIFVCLCASMQHVLLSSCTDLAICCASLPDETHLELKKCLKLAHISTGEKWFPLEMSFCTRVFVCVCD